MAEDRTNDARLVKENTNADGSVDTAADPVDPQQVLNDENVGRDGYPIDSQGQPPLDRSQNPQATERES